VRFLGDGVHQAFRLLLHPDADFRSILSVTMQVALFSAAIALVVGVPIGLLLGVGRFRGRRALLAGAYGGFGLPPVLVGLVVALLLFRTGPLGSLGWIYSVPGMLLAQFILDLPVVVALTATAAHAVEPELLEQARAFGVSRLRLGLFTMREARHGIIVAALAAIGAGLSEVGAVVLVGGNIDLQTRTMAGAILTSVSAGRYGQGIALGIVLLILVLVLTTLVMVVQHRSPRERDRLSLRAR
jgi:tungstate transport system permease protein